MKFIPLAFGLFAATSAAADLRFTCNAHGAVVTTAYGTVFYLGKACDAAKKGGGTGSWGYTASGFVIDIDGEGIIFPRTDIPCDIPYCKP